jgi:hypothetical protein
MKRILSGILFGVIAGALDLIPMVLQKLSLDADLSAFSFWVVTGFFIAVSDLKLISFVKGILFSLLVLLPAAVIIGAKEPFSLIPIFIMTLILGAFLGFFVEKLKQ